VGKWSIGGKRHWTELEKIQGIINVRVSGDSRVDPYLWFLRRYLGPCLPVRDALTIGCGTGELERGLCQYGFALRHEGVDLSEDAVDRAKYAARSASLSHLHYIVSDANRLDLPRNAFDVVFGVHSIHHVEALERLFTQIAQSLRPKGLLFLNEFMGPTRFQWSDRQLEIVNALLRVLPEEFRRSTVSGDVKNSVMRPTVEEMIATDPSEAIRSSEILEVASDYFELLEVRPYGGTVLQILLDDIAGNFAPPRPGGMELLAAIADLEWAIIEAGDLSSDFAVVVARPKRR